MEQHGGNINEINLENLFSEQPDVSDSTTMIHTQQSTLKLGYRSYCAVTEDFGTHHIDEEALRVLEGFGFPRSKVIHSLNSGELNHATTTYNLLVT